MTFHTRIAAALIFGAMALGLAPAGSGILLPAAQAQNLGLRTIDGTVLSADSAAVQGATVFLRNTKSKAIRSYTSTKDGKFRFAQVNMTEDFELWAEKGGQKSPTKTISSWDSRKSVAVELKLK